MTAIYFYDPDGEFGWLANYSYHPFSLDGRDWSTAEHYYQANKFDLDTDVERIQAATTPGEAKALSRAMAEHVRPDWPLVRESVMKRAIKAKFAQHPQLADLLLGTGQSELIEAARDDEYWGMGASGQGKNKMGKLLMCLRAELRSSRGKP